MNNKITISIWRRVDFIFHVYYQLMQTYEILGHHHLETCNIAYIYLDDFNIIISNTVSTWDIISFVPTKMCVILKLTVASWH